MPSLITTLGPKRADELGMILPHEHVFVDLRTPMTAEQAAAFSPRLRYMLGCNASAPVRG